MSVRNHFNILVFLFYLFPSFAICNATRVINPDEISVYFPLFSGPEEIGLKASTVLSLRLAQTSRKYPWPNNPLEHDFGEGMLIWGVEPLYEQSYKALSQASQLPNVLAQIVVSGQTKYYGSDVIVETVIALPEYKKAPSLSCEKNKEVVCDFRTKNFEVWHVEKEGLSINVGPPRRYFNVSTIVLSDEIIKQFSSTKGLAIYDHIDIGREIGRTNENIRFLEFNSRLPNAPTKIRSNNIEGYISLPELSKKKGEFIAMVGGIWQVYRGDWDAAFKSFTQVIDNSQTRVPLKIDALLYLGMIKFKQGKNGTEYIERAAELAPYDETVLKYRIMASMVSGQNSNIKSLIDDNSLLFEKESQWFNTVIKML